MVVKHQQLVEIYIAEKKLVEPYPNNLHAIVKQLHRFQWNCRNPVCSNIIDLNSCKNKIKLFCDANCRQQFYHHKDDLEALKKKFEPRVCPCGKPTPLGPRSYHKYCSDLCRGRYRKDKV